MPHALPRPLLPLVGLVTVLLFAGLPAAPGATALAPRAAVATQPRRLVDTRTSQPLQPGAVLRVAAPAASDAGATAITVNLTATDAWAPGYLTAWPCEQPMPATSVLNFRPGHPDANLAALGFDDEICLASSAPVHVIVDLMGWFTGSADLRGTAPDRLLDTRTDRPLQAFQPYTLRVAGQPGPGAAAVLNVTATAPAADGYVVAYPCGTTPPTSTVNFRAGEDVAALTIVAPAGGDVCFISSVRAHLVVDRFGWVPGGGSLIAQPPSRILDTRQPSWPYGAAQSGSKITVQLSSRGGIPNDAAGAFLTVTAVDATSTGYVTIWPCDGARPDTSIVNTWPGSLRANLAFVALADDGTACVQAHSDSGAPVQLLVDAVGYTTGGPDRPEPPADPTPPTGANPPPGPGNPTAHFSTLPPGSALPSGAECASRVRPAAENRPANAGANATTWAAQPTEIVTARRADGQFTGSTDEILQWAACKWGIDEDIVRAQAAKESAWHQDALGDRTGNNCAPLVPQPTPCGESIGLMQVRWNYHQAAFEGAVRSSAYNVDYAYAAWRDCYEGNTTWLGGSYGAGDLWGCVGLWFSGRWHDAAATEYIAAVQDLHDRRVWTLGDFANW